MNLLSEREIMPPYWFETAVTEAKVIEVGTAGHQITSQMERRHVSMQVYIILPPSNVKKKSAADGTVRLISGFLQFLQVLSVTRGLIQRE